MDESFERTLRESFHLYMSPVEKADFIMERDRFVQRKGLESAILHRTTILQGLETRVGGANLMKWISLFFAAHSYARSVKNARLVVDHFSFVSQGKQGGFIIEGVELRPLPIDNREEEVYKDLLRLIHEWSPTIQLLAKEAGLPLTHAFGLLAFPFYQQQSNWLKVEKRQHIRENILRDEEQLRGIAGQAFGLKHNPFNVRLRYADSWKEPIEPVLIKPACCLSYLKVSGSYCYSCPKLTVEQRIAKGNELRKKALSS